MTVSRRWPKSRHILVGIVLTGILFLAGTQTWWRMSIHQGATVSIQGSAAVSAIVAIGLALLALCAALSLCGTLSARILSVLEVLFALSGGLLIILALGDPIAAARPTLATATGVSGVETLHTLVDRTTNSPWPAITIVVFVLLAVHGILGWVTSAKWKTPGGYQSQRRAVVDLEDSASVWDALSDGEDPTRNS